MKGYVSRAYQISCMEFDQVERLHEREKTCGFIIPNWNIQELFGVPSARTVYNLPVENELLAINNVRLEKELKDKGFLKVGMFDESLSWYHAFDKKVCEKKDQIIWEYAGPRKDRRNLVQTIEQNDGKTRSHF